MRRELHAPRPERQALAALVRATAVPSPARLAECRQCVARANPDALIELLAHLRITTALGRLLLGEGEAPLPERLDRELRERRNVARARGVLNHEVTQRLIRALAERGISALPLKGAQLAELAYGDIAARESADIDVLVRAGDLDAAVAVAEEQGWREPDLPHDAGRPRLHRELVHASLPPLEIHWRVHWYEEEFAAAALSRALPGGDTLPRMQPADELVCLMLFLVRDGFAGLRQTLDVAAWWAATPQRAQASAGVQSIIARHPALRPALTAAARHVEELAGIPSGSLGADGKLYQRQRAALGLANPWLTGSRQQVDATISVIDGLLSPPGGGLAFLRRQLLQSRHAAVRRQPGLQGSSGLRIAIARAAHTLRMLIRYGLAGGRLIARRRD